MAKTAVLASPRRLTRRSRRRSPPLFCCRRTSSITNDDDCIGCARRLRLSSTKHPTDASRGLAPIIRLHKHHSLSSPRPGGATGSGMAVGECVCVCVEGRQQEQGRLYTPHSPPPPPHSPPPPSYSPSSSPPLLPPVLPRTAPPPTDKRGTKREPAGARPAPCATGLHCECLLSATAMN